MDATKIKKAREELKAEILDAVRAGVADGTIELTNAQHVTDAMMEKFEERFAKLEKQVRSHSLPGSETDTHKGEGYSFGKVFKALSTGEFEKYASMEYAHSKEIYAQGTVDDEAGGFLVPRQTFESEIIPLLRPKVIVLDLGINTINISGTHVVELPRETSGPTNEPVAENHGSGDTNVAFGSMELSPHTSQSYIKASRRFFSVGVGAESFIRRRIAKELALTWNRWVLKGTGADGEPIGVLNAAGISSVDFAGTIAAGGRVTPAFFKQILAMEDALADADALEGADSMGWACANRFVRACRVIESDNNATGTTNLEMGRKVITGGKMGEIIEYPYKRTTQLAQGTDTDAILGDWGGATLATWNNMTLETSNSAEDAMRRRQTHMVAHIDVDVAVTEPKSFCVAQNLNTTNV